ncbi:GLIPR1-like protein 1 [Sorex fumeus]|uniref:GLIPR1-like protein 1 n=1 Tax=Sorex fumeus TaxID=62283 RepID=UPI0024AE8286|nr:GLIPR1-like protein 1 [Sorex fumeus]
MLRENLRWLWTLGLYLVTSKSSPKVPTITDRAFMDLCVLAHNQLRIWVHPPAADMKEMSWESSLAKVAYKWANKCKFEHNGCLSSPFACDPNHQFLGENIWLGSLSIFSPKSAVEAWYNETQYYNYNTLACTDVCGHYTQVVWAVSNKVGCAAALCPNLGGYHTTIFVCNYAPPGNFPNMPPYTKGTPCSLCEPGEICRNKLCRSKEQQKAEVLESKAQQKPERVNKNSSALIQLLPSIETKFCNPKHNKNLKE